MDKTKIIQRLETLTTLQKTLIWIGTFGLLIGGYSYLVFWPLWQQWQIIERDIANLDKEIASYRLKVAHLPKLRKEYNRQRKILLLAKSLLPESSQDVEKLLSNIETLGRNVGVEFVMFAPENKEQVKKYYAQRIVRLTIKGQFHNLMSFFSQLSRLNRLVTLQSVQFTPQHQKESTQVLLSANSQLAIYRSLTPEEKKKQAKKRKK